jgi:peptidyl-prolyl cis-trans isomerase SurA
MPSGNLYSFADQNYSVNEFANYIEKRGSMIITKDSSVFISRALETMVSDQLLNYENSVLEAKYPEFRYLLKEFHDGMLLFEISGRKVWNRVNDDSLGMRRYYEEHKNSYLTPAGIEAKIYTLRSQGGEKMLSSEFKKYSRMSDTDTRLASKFNNKNDTLLIITENTWYKGDDNEIDNLKWISGSQSFVRNGFPAIIRIKKIIEPVPLEFEKVQREMLTGYQEYLEIEWMRQLKEKYSVKIDSLVLKDVKKKLNNE